jgi:hypothetical protein
MTLDNLQISGLCLGTGHDSSARKLRMGSLLNFERLRWFDLQVRNDQFPNASTLVVLIT